MTDKIVAPDRIYLQVVDEDGEAPDEVTWCVDRVHDTDVEYYRVSWEDEESPPRGFAEPNADHNWQQ